MKQYVLSFKEIDGTKLVIVGGKGLNLGELCRIEGVLVPDGFCITTGAYRNSVESNGELKMLTEKLAALKSNELQRISEISGRIRSIIENLRLAGDIEAEITGELSLFSENQAYAIRSSATAEDLPDASFAGQQDTYLNIRGRDEILRHVVKCWASLFTDRAVTYRIQNGVDHRSVLLSVVVQKMIIPDASGIMFTADPVTSDRKTLSIDAGFGLGEALVSGLVNPDTYKVREGEILSGRIGTKIMEVRPVEGGGVQKSAIKDNRQKKQVLSDAQIISLSRIGKKIEDHFGLPQDIEWCLAGNEFHIVQSRPITTLFPPPVSKDGKKRVYISSGHLQVMTDPILPLGMSVLELASLYPLDRAGGRMFVDITHDLTTPQGRRMIRQKVDNMDPLMASAIRKLMLRRDFLKSLPRGKGNLLTGINFFKRVREAIRIYRKNDPAIFDEMVKMHERKLEKCKRELESLSGDKVFDFILKDKKDMQAVLYDATGFGAILACFFVSDRLNGKMEKWLGERNITSILSKSVERNITSEMGLALCNVADIIRKYPEVYKYCSQPDEGDFPDGLARLEGGVETGAAIEAFLDKYGMRCPAEIDITRPRWYEKPAQLLPLIMSDIGLLASGQHIRKFEQGRYEAEAMGEEILRRLSQLPGGAKKVKKTKRMISIFRNFVGAREYPKYFLICRYALYKRALLKEADKLVAEGVIKDRSDVYYLYLEEFREAVRSGYADYSLVERRKKEYAHYQKLTPPRVIMSDGEVPSGEYEGGNIPEGALVGVPVSSGIIEGRARVVERLEDAHVEQGDILVTAFTDPSWTPVFVFIAGLVTEVGGTMSHGAVITREYGLPAVVGVENATRLVKDGQRIRLNGTEGFVEIL